MEYVYPYHNLKHAFGKKLAVKRILQREKKLARIALVDGEVIQVQEYATIVKGDEPAGFYNLKDGDDITVFGLEDCEDNNNGIDFYGFVIIVEDN